MKEPEYIPYVTHILSTSGSEKIEYDKEPCYVPYINQTFLFCLLQDECKEDAAGTRAPPPASALPTGSAGKSFASNFLPNIRKYEAYERRFCGAFAGHPVVDRIWVI